MSATEPACTATTGHAEVIQITYDRIVVSFAELLEVFWRTHDLTTPNQQGASVFGTDRYAGRAVFGGTIPVV